MSLPASVPTWAALLVGVPYSHRSRDPQYGLDCLTLLEVCFDRLGRRFPLPADYTPEAVPAEQLAALHRHLEACGPEDWAIVEIGAGHCGILLPGCTHVLHAQPGKGVVAHRLAVIRPHVTAFYRLRDEDEEAAA